MCSRFLALNMPEDIDHDLQRIQWDDGEEESQSDQPVVILDPDHVSQTNN